MPSSQETQLSKDLTSWEVGPYHGSLPAPMIVRLSLDGEIVVHCSLETGFLHRGLEKAFEVHSWSSLTPYADHLDPEHALFGELVLCEAVEEIAGIEVPIRARRIRLILAELTRLSAHLLFIVKMAKSVGTETIIHYVLRDREKILDLFELLTGARFSINFLRFGGVRADVTEGFIERILEVCELIRIRMREYNDLFTFNYSFLKRTATIAPLSVSLIEACGITGPNARASGVPFDHRKNEESSEYQTLDFEVPLGRGEGGRRGDVHDRFLVRLREIGQSIELLKQLAEKLPRGEYLQARIAYDLKIPSGEAYSHVESSRGLLGCYVVSDGKGRPNRVQFRTPTVASLMAVPELVRGIRVEDIPVVLASLDLGIAEADR